MLRSVVCCARVWNTLFKGDLFGVQRIRSNGGNGYCTLGNANGVLMTILYIPRDILIVWLIHRLTRHTSGSYAVNSYKNRCFIFCFQRISYSCTELFPLLLWYSYNSTCSSNECSISLYLSGLSWHSSTSVNLYASSNRWNNCPMVPVHASTCQAIPGPSLVLYVCIYLKC